MGESSHPGSTLTLNTNMSPVVSDGEHLNVLCFFVVRKQDTQGDSQRIVVEIKLKLSYRNQDEAKLGYCGPSEKKLHGTSLHTFLNLFLTSRLVRIPTENTNI